jgi:hypothetical protein
MIDVAASNSINDKNAFICSLHICVTPAAHNVQCDLGWILVSPVICHAIDLLHFQKEEGEVAPAAAWWYSAVISSHHLGNFATKYWVLLVIKGAVNQSYIRQETHERK